MSTEQNADLERRVTVHAALADQARLRITDALAEGDASPSELGVLLAMPSNLLAHHLHVLKQAGIIARRRSEGDRRRSYLRLAPGALDAARRHQLPLPRRRPRHISGAREDGDLVITVCDRAHEELGGLAVLHWSVPDPVPAGDPDSFDAALDELSRRVGQLAPRLTKARATQLARRGQVPGTGRGAPLVSPASDLRHKSAAKWRRGCRCGPRR